MRRSLVLLVAWLATLALVHWRARPALDAAPAYQVLGRQNPLVARVVRRAFEWGWLSGLPLLALGSLNFLEAHGWLGGERRRRGPLPPCPFDPDVPALVLGEVHEQEGARSERPGWLTLPEKGLYAGILVVGATGRGKTTGVLYPLLKQLVSLHPGRPDERLAGLVIDAKGNMAADVVAMLASCGREGDYYELSIPTARYNLLNRPDLSATALGGHVGDLIANVTGGATADAFWPQAAKELAVQAIRVLRLASDDPPTLADVYRIAASPRAFEQALLRARSRRNSQDLQIDELESLEVWVRDSLARMDPRTRSNVAANLNMLCSLFDEPLIRRCFCPSRRDEIFPGFEWLIEQGKVVVLSLPKSRFKVVSDVVATAVKLNFQDAVLGRLARAERANSVAGRAVFCLADEFGNYVTAPGDASFLSQCREARCITLLAVQSYESLTAKLRHKADVEVLLANLATKVWLGLEDTVTAQAAANLCGKVERLKQSVSVGEGAPRAAFSFLDGRAVSEGPSSASAGAQWSPRLEYLFPPDFFTGSLPTFTAIAKVFDGERSLPPWVVYLKPSFAEAGPPQPPPAVRKQDRVSGRVTGP